MKLIPCDPSEVKAKRPYGNNQAILEEFNAMNIPCVKYEGFTQKSASNCAAAMNLSAKRMGFHNVRAISRKGEVFMIRTDLIESV